MKASIRDNPRRPPWVSLSAGVWVESINSGLSLGSLVWFYLWFTANAMRKPNHFSLSYWQTTYATCGKHCVCFRDGYSWTTSFARVRKATSLQVITQFFLLLKIGIMASVSVTRVKFLLMLYCRVRAYTFGSHYFVEVDIVLPENMRLQEAHNIGETQEMLEQLVEVERAFVHIDFGFTHRPEHKYS
ncbi:hypothetical protein IGI04_022304 [Brassica rapa subsp. trilocularis]|uniref:Cation efflux protein cytoplasmic domain-containing protein n=1 Tax=Brassica rapa subsp. trilocularis TaxID=1813537 RepID=A0ABQ7M0J4_BRACM|nr:hypothetical protein IGI04_022304 [Brassica rapa subsp. trilocularis]